MLHIDYGIAYDHGVRVAQTRSHAGLSCVPIPPESFVGCYDVNTTRFHKLELKVDEPENLSDREGSDASLDDYPDDDNVGANDDRAGREVLPVGKHHALGPDIPMAPPIDQDDINMVDGEMEVLEEHTMPSLWQIEQQVTSRALRRVEIQREHVLTCMKHLLVPCLSCGYVIPAREVSCPHCHAFSFTNVTSTLQVKMQVYRELVDYHREGIELVTKSYSGGLRGTVVKKPGNQKWVKELCGRRVKRWAQQHFEQTGEDLREIATLRMWYEMFPFANVNIQEAINSPTSSLPEKSLEEFESKVEAYWEWGCELLQNAPLGLNQHNPKSRDERQERYSHKPQYRIPGQGGADSLRKKDMPGWRGVTQGVRHVERAIRESREILRRLPQEASLLALQGLDEDEMREDAEFAADSINAQHGSASAGSDAPPGLAGTVARRQGALFGLSESPADFQRRVDDTVARHREESTIRVIARIAPPEINSKDAISYCHHCADYEHAIVWRIGWWMDGKYGYSMVGCQCKTCDHTVYGDDRHYGVCFGCETVFCERCSNYYAEDPIGASRRKKNYAPGPQRCPQSSQWACSFWRRGRCLAGKYCESAHFEDQSQFS